MSDERDLGEPLLERIHLLESERDKAREDAGAHRHMREYLSKELNEIWIPKSIRLGETIGVLREALEDALDLLAEWQEATESVSEKEVYVAVETAGRAALDRKSD